MPIRMLCLFLLALFPSGGAVAKQWSTSGDGMRCVPLRHADTVQLWIRGGEEEFRAVEGSEETAAKRGDRVWGHLFFEVQFGVNRPKAKCMRVRWRVEPWGAHPVDSADFDGRLPSGYMDLFYSSDDHEVGGAIQLWAPDDGKREGPETFRLVLLDPVTGAPLAGRVGRYNPNTGWRARNASPSSLDMRRRLVMTVEDAPEQARR